MIRRYHCTNLAEARGLNDHTSLTLQPSPKSQSLLVSFGDVAQLSSLHYKTPFAWSLCDTNRPSGSPPVLVTLFCLIGTQCGSACFSFPQPFALHLKLLHLLRYTCLKSRPSTMLADVSKNAPLNTRTWVLIRLAALLAEKSQRVSAPTTSINRPTCRRGTQAVP